MGCIVSHEANIALDPNALPPEGQRTNCMHEGQHPVPDPNSSLRRSDINLDDTDFLLHHVYLPNTPQDPRVSLKPALPIVAADAAALTSSECSSLPSSTRYPLLLGELSIPSPALTMQAEESHVFQTRPISHSATPLPQNSPSLCALSTSFLAPGSPHASETSAADVAAPALTGSCLSVRPACVERVDNLPSSPYATAPGGHFPAPVPLLCEDAPSPAAVPSPASSSSSAFPVRALHRELTVSMDADPTDPTSARALWQAFPPLPTDPRVTSACSLSGAATTLCASPALASTVHDVDVQLYARSPRYDELVCTPPSNSRPANPPSRHRRPHTAPRSSSIHPTVCVAPAPVPAADVSLAQVSTHTPPMKPATLPYSHTHAPHASADSLVPSPCSLTPAAGLTHPLTHSSGPSCPSSRRLHVHESARPTTADEVASASRNRAVTGTDSASHARTSSRPQSATAPPHGGLPPIARRFSAGSPLPGFSALTLPVSTSAASSSPSRATAVSPVASALCMGSSPSLASSRSLVSQSQPQSRPSSALLPAVVRPSSQSTARAPSVRGSQLGDFTRATRYGDHDRAASTLSLSLSSSAPSSHTPVGGGRRVGSAGSSLTAASLTADAPGSSSSMHAHLRLLKHRSRSSANGRLSPALTSLTTPTPASDLHIRPPYTASPKLLSAHPVLAAMPSLASQPSLVRASAPAHDATLGLDLSHIVAAPAHTAMSASDTVDAGVVDARSALCASTPLRASCCLSQSAHVGLLSRSPRRPSRLRPPAVDVSVVLGDELETDRTPALPTLTRASAQPPSRPLSSSSISPTDLTGSASFALPPFTRAQAVLPPSVPTSTEPSIHMSLPPTATTSPPRSSCPSVTAARAPTAAPHTGTSPMSSRLAALPSPRVSLVEAPAGGRAPLRSVPLHSARINANADSAAAPHKNTVHCFSPCQCPGASRTRGQRLDFSFVGDVSLCADHPRVPLALVEQLWPELSRVIEEHHEATVLNQSRVA